MNLDLGCGIKKKEGYVGVDLSPKVNPDVVLDLIYGAVDCGGYRGWPWEDSSIDNIYTSHFIEHVPMDYVPGTNKDLFVRFMENCYRILKPNGLLEIVAPAVTHESAFGDPTHRRFISRTTWRYFDKSWMDEGGLGHYDIQTNFVPVNISQNIDKRYGELSDQDKANCMYHNWNVVAEWHVILRAVKPL